MKRTHFLITILLLAAAFAWTRPAAAQDDEPTGPILTIATKEIEPFVFHNEEGELVGFSVDLWQAIAEQAGLEYDWLEVETIEDQMDAVASGRADAAISAISMTPEREEAFDFSYAYIEPGLHIMAQPRITTIVSTFLQVLLSPQFLYAFGALFLFIIVVGHIVWLIERRDNSEDFPRSYVQGVWEGIWWAAVTVTTVGYGDRTPRAFLGRLIGLLWMFAGLVVASNFTAALASQLTLNQLQSSVGGLEDLPDQRIVTVADTTAAEWLNEQGLRFSEVETIDDAYARLEEDGADVIVYDAPVLLHKAATAERGEFVIVGEMFNRENYGILLPPDSAHRDAIDRALLTLFANGTYDGIHRQWFATSRYE